MFSQDRQGAEPGGHQSTLSATGDERQLIHDDKSGHFFNGVAIASMLIAALMKEKIRSMQLIRTMMQGERRDDVRRNAGCDKTIVRLAKNCFDLVSTNA